MDVASTQRAHINPKLKSITWRALRAVSRACACATAAPALARSVRASALGALQLQLSIS